MDSPIIGRDLFVVGLVATFLLYGLWVFLDTKIRLLEYRHESACRVVDSLESELREVRANLVWECGHELRHDVPHVMEARHDA